MVSEFGGDSSWSEMGMLVLALKSVRTYCIFYSHLGWFGLKSNILKFVPIIYGCASNELKLKKAEEEKN